MHEYFSYFLCMLYLVRFSSFIINLHVRFSLLFLDTESSHKFSGFQREFCVCTISLCCRTIQRNVVWEHPYGSGHGCYKCWHVVLPKVSRTNNSHPAQSGCSPRRALDSWTDSSSSPISSFKDTKREQIFPQTPCNEREPATNAHSTRKKGQTIEAVVNQVRDGRSSHHSFIHHERVTTVDAQKLPARTVDAKEFSSSQITKRVCFHRW